MAKSATAKAFDLAVKAKHEHFYGKSPCQVCWNFFGSHEWAQWMNAGHNPDDHPCRTKQALDAEVRRTCDAWIAS